MSDVSMAVSASPRAQSRRQIRRADLVSSPARRADAQRGAQFLPWLVPALLILGWELLARVGKIPPYILPPPSKVVVTGIALIQDGTLLPDMAISLLRAAT